MCTMSRRLYRFFSYSWWMMKKKFRRALDYWLDTWETTALHLAVELGDEEEALRLIEEEWADVGKKNEFGFSSMKIAANCRNYKMLKLLAPYSNNPAYYLHAHTNDIVSSKFRDWNIEEYLMEIYVCHPLINLQDYMEYTPLQMMVELLPDQIKVIKQMLEDGSDPHVRDPHGNNCLHTISLIGSIISAQEKKKLAALFIDKGVDINAKNNSHNTPLHLAIRQEPSLIALLMRRGADVNRINYSKLTAFDLALRTNKITLSTLFIKYIVLAQHRGCSIRKKIIEQIETNQILNAIYVGFGKEMENLRVEKITGSCYVTYHHMITLGRNKVAKLLGNEEILEGIMEYTTTHNSYEYDIFQAITQALKIKKMEDMSFDVVSNIFGDQLPYICARKISSYLTLQDVGVLQSFLIEKSSTC